MTKKKISKKHVLYSSPGCGSVIVEILFELAKIPYENVILKWEHLGHDSKVLKKINPLGQVPTLILPDQTVMTESAAIAFYVNDLKPKAKLMPSPKHPRRADFLRWLIFLVASIYPTFTYGDLTGRWTEGQNAEEKLKQTTNEMREKLWLFLESHIEKGPWFLGKDFSALDVYLAVMVYWRPRQEWFQKNCPKIYAISQKASKNPVIAKILKENF